MGCSQSIDGALHGFFTPLVLCSKYDFICEAYRMRTQMEADNLDVGLLRTFLALVEHGSMGKTAVAVDKTQPAISQQMLRLEKIVRQKLFVRGRNGTKLT